MNDIFDPAFVKMQNRIENREIVKHCMDNLLGQIFEILDDHERVKQDKLRWVLN